MRRERRVKKLDRMKNLRGQKKKRELGLEKVAINLQTCKQEIK